MFSAQQRSFLGWCIHIMSGRWQKINKAWCSCFGFQFILFVTVCTYIPHLHSLHLFAFYCSLFKWIPPDTTMYECLTIIHKSTVRISKYYHLCFLKRSFFIWPPIILIVWIEISNHSSLWSSCFSYYLQTLSIFSNHK